MATNKKTPDLKTQIATAVKPSKARINLPQGTSKTLNPPSYEEFEALQQKVVVLQNEKLALEDQNQKSLEKLSEANAKIRQQSIALSRFGVG